MRAPVQRLARSVLATQGHEAGHFVFGQFDLLAAPVGQGHVGNLVRQLRFNLRHGHSLLEGKTALKPARQPGHFVPAGRFETSSENVSSAYHRV